MDDGLDDFKRASLAFLAKVTGLCDEHITMGTSCVLVTPERCTVCRDRAPTSRPYGDLRRFGPGNPA